MIKHEGDLKYFNALSDVFLHAIKKQNLALSEKISRFFYDEFKKFREESDPNNPIEYPYDYYIIVYKSIEELALLQNKKNSSLKYMTSGGIWLLGESSGFEISETTYTWLWRNIRLAIKYEQDDLIIYHWEHAHQYFTFQLRYIYPEYEGGGLGNQTNQDLVEKRKKERKRFLEFHYALGGLLLYKERYSCIQKIFNYTTSEPPRYELLPESMNEIFNRYIEFRDPYDVRFSWISSKYSFPDLHGLNSDRVIKKWIASYTALLFLRQYTIRPYLITQKPLDFPPIPGTQGERKEWIDNLDFFRKLVSECLENVELINKLNLGFITREWSKENGNYYPLDFIDEFKKILLNAYESGAIYQEISDKKRELFYNSTKSILESTLDSYAPINNLLGITGACTKIYVNGITTIFDKDAFSENPEVDFRYYDKILASGLAERINNGISSSFLVNTSKSYLIKPEDIFNAVKNLGINENYLIIAFGIDLHHYTEFLKIEGLSQKGFNGIPIYSYPGSHSVRQSLFIINKSNLPQITTIKIEDSIIQKYSLKRISDKYYIYASVLDVNKVSQEILNENLQNMTESEFRKSALLNITQSTEITWKKNIELIHITEYSAYRQEGLPNSLNDIKKMGAE